MKKIDLTLNSEDIRTIMRLLDEETDRLFQQGNDDWKRIGAIRGAIMVSVYEHAMEEKE